MKQASSLDYIFGVGKIRALEKFLLTSEIFEEAIEVGINEALRIFVESNLYSEELLRIKESHELEAVLDNEVTKLKRLISDLILDRQLLCLLEYVNLNDIRDTIRNYKSEFLNDYVSHLIDMHNIKTFMRLYVLKQDEKELKENLIEGGFINTKDLIKLYRTELAAFLVRLEYVHKHNRIIDYNTYLSDAIQKAEKELSFIALEKSINDILVDILKAAKYINFGPEPVLAYYFAKRNEIDLIRMIIMAKLNNIPQGLIKERLNTVYA